MDSITVKIKKLVPEAQLPSRGSEYAAGYDLYYCGDETINIPAHGTVKIGTGVAVDLPEGTFGAIFARSGLATKRGLRPANAVGVIDSDYRGELIVALHNDTETSKTIDSFERIGQLVVLPYFPIVFEEVDELSVTERGEGGFGSTGEKQTKK